MSDKIDTGGFAFARQGSRVDFGDGWIPSQDGMTLLDYFAAKAMTGMIDYAGTHIGTDGAHERLARRCYEIAQAMLAEKRRIEGGL